MPPGSSKNLHSRYNPQGEAEKYVNSLVLKEGISFFILIEPGLGYLVPPLRKKNPDAKIIALHCSRPDVPEEGENHPDASWYPESGRSLQSFLETEIPDTMAGTIRIVEWRPGLGVFGAAYRTLMEETAEFIKRADANARTAGEFGRRWFRNFFRNLELLERILIPSRLSLPVVAAGAGPGLEDAISLIDSGRRKGALLILAASSAAPALEARGLIPDLVIAADGGNWARLHLNECWRRIFGKESGRSCTGLAAALTAALPSQYAGVPILPISDGSLWQRTVLSGLKIPSLALPQRGTVSASALDLAFYLTGGKIYITGMDLALTDIRSHARPYGFDALWEQSAGRLNPVYSQAFTRALGIRAGGSHEIYAAWFSRRLGAWRPRRLFSLGKNNPVFGLPAAPGFEGGQIEQKPPRVETLLLKKPKSPAKEAAALLAAALQDPQHGEKTAGELKELLFPGPEPVSLKDLEEAVLSLAVLPGRHE